MRTDRIVDQCYFEWLYNKVAKGRYSKDISYDKLLLYLHSVDFRWSIPKDENRAKDGIDLRRRFANEFYRLDRADLYLEGPCSVLEMMVALATRCEENIMDNAVVGDRTGQWFWNMIVSLGLGSMLDDRFDEQYVEDRVDIFLDREYEANGKGGLFTVNNATKDLRTVEIWYQLCWYLDNIM